MSEQHPNLALIHSFFHAYSSNDMVALKDILSPTIQWIIPGKHRLSGTKNGAEEVIAYFKELSRYSFAAKPIVMGVNDEYVIDCHLNWSNCEEGKNMEAMSCLLWKIKDGKIIKVYNFPEDQHLVDAFFNQD